MFAEDVQYLAEGLSALAPGYINEGEVQRGLMEKLPGGTHEGKLAATQTARYYMIVYRTTHLVKNAAKHAQTDHKIGRVILTLNRNNNRDYAASCEEYSLW